jgi:hypothetical protein
LDLPGSTYLYTLAALSITFVGFSALVIYLRQTVGGEMSKLDVLITRIFIQLGFIVVAGAMLPPLLSLFDWPHDLIWRTASFVAAALSFFFGATYPARRRAASGVRTPAVVWLDVLILLAAAAVLICNAAGFGLKPSPGPYAAALTAILFLGGWSYLQALNTLLAHHKNRADNAPRAPK